MPTQSGPSRPGPPWWLALALCMVGALCVLWEPLVGERSALSFDQRHPAYAAPWAAPDGGTWPLVNPITSDGDYLVMPNLMRISQLQAAGLSPWWDRSQVLGCPLGANQAYPLFQPTARLAIGREPVQSLDWLLWFHMVLASFGAWRAVRVLGGSGLAGALAAVGFTLSTWMVTRWHLPQITYVTACFPGLVVAVEWLRRGRLATAVAEGGFWLGLGLLSGFPQVAMLFVAGFLTMVALERRLHRPAPLMAAACAVALGLAMAAPLFNAVRTAVPGAARSSARTQLMSASVGLSPAALLGGVVPEFFGRPSDFATENPPSSGLGTYLPRRLLLGDDVQDNPVEDALYPGVLVLLLASCLLRRGVDGRARQLGLLAALAVAGALLAPWLVRSVPGLASFGLASTKRLVVLSAACLPLAAALALDAVGRRQVRAPVWAGIALAVFLGGLTLLVSGWDQADAPAFRESLTPQLLRQAALVLLCCLLLVFHGRGVRLVGALAVLVLFADLAQLGRTFNPFPPQQVAFPETPGLNWLAQRPGRIAVLGQRRLLPATVVGLHGLRSIHGSIPLLDKATGELLCCLEEDILDWRDPRTVEPLRREQTLDHALLDLLEVRSVIHADIGLAARRGTPNAYENVAEGFAVQDRPSAGPRAFVCGGVELQPEGSVRLEFLSRPDAPVHETVLIEAPLGDGWDLPRRGPMTAAHIQRDQDGVLELSVDAPVDGLLVVVESFHGDWRATVDGESMEILRVDHALMGLPLRAGPHQVRFEFVLPGEDAAAWIQALAAGLCAALAVWGLVRWRRQGPSAA